MSSSNPLRVLAALSPNHFVINYTTSWTRERKGLLLLTSVSRVARKNPRALYVFARVFLSLSFASSSFFHLISFICQCIPVAVFSATARREKSQRFHAKRDIKKRHTSKQLRTVYLLNWKNVMTREVTAGEKIGQRTSVISLNRQI